MGHLVRRVHCLHQIHILSSLSTSRLFCITDLQIGFSIQRGTKRNIVPDFLIKPLNMIDLTGRPLSLRPFQDLGYLLR